MDKNNLNLYERKEDSHHDSQERLKKELQNKPSNMNENNERSRDRPGSSMRRDSRGRNHSRGSHHSFLKEDIHEHHLYSKGSFSGSPHRSPRHSPRRSPRGSPSVSPRHSPRRSPRHSSSHRNYQNYAREGRRREFPYRNPGSPIRYHKKTSRENSSENKGNVLYVSNIPRRISESYLREKFSKYGKLEGLNIIKQPGTNENRGFGFVTFEDSKCAEEARLALDKTKLDNYELKVELSKRSIGHQPTPGVYLGPKSERRRYIGRYYERREFHREGRSRSRSFRRSHSRRRSYYHNYPSRDSRSRDRRHSRTRSREFDYRTGKR